MLIYNAIQSIPSKDNMQYTGWVTKANSMDNSNTVRNNDNVSDKNYGEYNSE